MRDGSATKRAVTAAALALFSERGVNGTTIRDIARAARVSEGAIYVHYRSKEDIVTAIFRDGYAAYAARLRVWLTGNGSFAERLSAAVHGICRLYDEDPVLFNFLLLHQHGALAGVADDANNPVSVLQAALAEAFSQGEARATDPALATAMVVGLIIQPATFRLYGRLPGSLESHAEAIAAACLKVLS